MHVEPISLKVLASEDMPSTSVTHEEAAEQAPEPLKGQDPYTLSADGHFVGHDGFIIPKDFAEFYARFPGYIRGFVRLSAVYGTESEYEDWAQDLCVHLVSATKGMRTPGFNGRPDGCTDRIQTFNPELSHGASFFRFFHWLKVILRYRLYSVARRKKSDPLAKLEVSNERDDPSGGSTGSHRGDEYSGGTSQSDFLVDMRESIDNRDTRVMFQQFGKYVRNFNPELISVMEALAYCGNYSDAQEALGMSEKTLLRSRARLRTLYRCYLSRGSEMPPAQRRSYRPQSNPRTIERTWGKAKVMAGI